MPPTWSGLSGTEPLLIEKIDAEYSRYFTATGRPTGEWAAATTALAAADADVADCAAAVAEVHDRVRRHAQLTEELAEMTGGRAELTARLAAAETAATAIGALSEELRAAQNEATAATATSTAAAAAHKERLRLRADADTRAAAVAEAEAAAAEAAESAATGRAVLEAAEEAAAAAAVALQEAQARADAARRAVTELSDRDEADRLTARLGRIDAAQRDLGRLAGELRDIPLTERGFRDIESGSAAVDLARAQVDLTAPTVAFTAESDVVLVIGDQRVTLTAGQTHSLTVAEATAIGLPGVGTFAITPGAPAADTQAKLAAAQRLLAEALAGPGVADVDVARRLDQTRRDLLSQRDQLDRDAVRAAGRRRRGTVAGEAGDVAADPAAGDLGRPGGGARRTGCRRCRTGPGRRGIARRSARWPQRRPRSAPSDPCVQRFCVRRPRRPATSTPPCGID